MSDKIWRFLLVWTWIFILFALYSIAIEKDPVWFHVVCVIVQLAFFILSAVIVSKEVSND